MTSELLRPTRYLLALTLSFAALAVVPVVPVQAAPDNMVVDWNQIMVASFAKAPAVPAPPAARLSAIVQSAVFDAVNGIEQRYEPIHVQPAAPQDASPKAAAASAAHTTLVDLFPLQKTALDAEFAASMATLADDEDAQSVNDGVAWGASVGAQVFAWRANDSTAPPPYTFKTDPGQWQPTPGGPAPGAPPRFRSLATTTPFALTSPSQFRPAGPPALTSARYAQDFNEIKALGGLTSTLRTPYQTQTAEFWQFDTGTAIWDRVADSLAIQHHLNLLQTARLLALTDISMADSSFAIWDAKNFYNFWRPVTAIVNAGVDGNPATTADPTWLPLLITPYHQEYPSGHSGLSSAAATVLASFFGEDTNFTLTSDGLPGVSRSFSSFSDAVAQVADARVFAGFHFRSSCDDAVVMGAQVATYVEGHLMLQARD